ncbi:Utilization protein for unknown catechol-siderophore X [gamma proteobacterium IMCC1989]|nr:Utilization protein for unknown catechol-siderophore X [gamma proteobacterium IMCC1989]
MAGRALRNVKVAQKTFLSPNMQRIILSGEALKDFPEGFESGYVKLRFLADVNDAYPTDASEEYLHSLANPKPRLRSYTVRAFDPKKCELTLDFVSHGDNGPASAWASACNIGDSISIDGPGPAKLINLAADWFFLAGDMAALPAMSVNLEKLPATAVGHVVIEVLSEKDKIDLAKWLTVPGGMSIHWVINQYSDSSNNLLMEKVCSLPWYKGDASVWVAAEFSSMKALRKYFKIEKQVNKNNIYISSYWKIGDTDEGHKQAKKADAETA